MIPENTDIIAGRAPIVVVYGVRFDTSTTTSKGSAFISVTLTMHSKTEEPLNFENITYTNLFKGKSSTASRSCGGDSGAPIYKETILYAVHTAGGL